MRKIILRRDTHGERAVIHAVIVEHGHLLPYLREDLVDSDGIAGGDIRSVITYDVVHRVSEIVRCHSAGLFVRTYENLVTLGSGEACDQSGLVHILRQTDKHVGSHFRNVILCQCTVVFGIKAVSKKFGLSVGILYRSVVRFRFGATPANRQARRRGDQGK